MPRCRSLGSPGADRDPEDALEPPFVLTLDGWDDHAVVRIGGVCDVTAVDAVRSSLAGAAAGPARSVEVDLAGCALLDCAAIGVLVAARRRLADDDRSLAVTGAMGLARRALCLTGAGRYLDVA